MRTIEQRTGVDQPDYEPPATAEPSLTSDWTRTAPVEIILSCLVPIAGIMLAVWRYRHGNVRAATVDLCCALTVLLVGFVLVAPSYGSMLPTLRMANARRAITTYETEYWHGQPVTLTVGQCRRRSARQITCIAEAASGTEHVTTTDWATVLAHGIIRVHPGRFLIVSG